MNTHKEQNIQPADRRQENIIQLVRSILYSCLDLLLLIVWFTRVMNFVVRRSVFSLRDQSKEQCVQIRQPYGQFKTCIFTN